MHLALVLLAAAQLAAPPRTPTELRREALMDALRAGGHTILVRHARTDRTLPNAERPDHTPPLRSDQRNLSPDGERDVRLMAEVVRRFAIPIGEVLSSPLYRCRETADAFGMAALTMTLRTWPTTSSTAALVEARPAPNTNRVLVTHHFVIEQHVPGIHPGEIGESEAVVVKSEKNGGVTVVGRITLEDWRYLAGDVADASADSPPAGAGHGNRLHALSARLAERLHGPARAVDLPSTKAGSLAAAYLEAFNSGDPVRMQQFIESRMTPGPERPTAARVDVYRRLFETYGELELLGAESPTPDTVRVTVRSRQGVGIVEVIAAPSADRAQSILLRLADQGGHR